MISDTRLKNNQSTLFVYFLFHTIYTADDIDYLRQNNTGYDMSCRTSHLWGWWISGQLIISPHKHPRPKRTLFYPSPFVFPVQGLLFHPPTGFIIKLDPVLFLYTCISPQRWLLSVRWWIRDALTQLADCRFMSRTKENLLGLILFPREEWWKWDQGLERVSHWWERSWWHTWLLKHTLSKKHYIERWVYMRSC